jgi:hypothetical protein
MAEANPYEQFKSDPPSAVSGGDGPGASDAPSPYSEPLAPGIDPLTRRPFQYVGNVPPGDPVGQSTGKPIQEDRAPGPAVQAAGSLATDPEQKRRIIAHQLFPKLPLNEATARIFYGPNGRMAAVGEDGQPYYVDPDRPDFSALRTFSPANLATNAATVAGAALPAVGGMAGGAAAGPTALVAGPLAAGAGAAVGDYLRQQLASLVDHPEARNQLYNYGQTARETVGAVLGQFGGNLLMRGLHPNPLGVSRFDRETLRRNPQILEQAEQRQVQAEAQGVHLTPGQSSGLPSLLQAEDTMASGSVRGRPDLSDIAKTWYDRQRLQLGGAADAALDRTSPAADSVDATLQFQQGASDATRIVRQQGNAVARPAYDAAKAGGQVMSPDLAQLAELPAVKKALKEAATEYHNRTGKVANLDAPDFELWDLVKRKLDDFHSEAKQNSQHTTADTMDTIRQRLVDNLDAAYPTYGPARDLAAPGQRLAEQLRRSAVGDAAKGEGTETTRSVLAPIFEQQNHRAVATQRAAFLQAGKEDEWNAGTRAYLQDMIDRASKSQDGLNPQSLRLQLWGGPNSKIRQNLQAAMDPEAFQGLENFMGTLERVAQSRGINSLTAPRQAGGEAIDQAATQASLAAFTSRGQRWAENPLRIIGDAIGSLGQRSKDRALTGIADRLFSADGLAYLRSMSQVSPLSERGLAATAEFLVQQAVAGRTPIPARPEPAMNPLRY